MRYLNHPSVFRPLAYRGTRFRRLEEVAWVRRSRRAAAHGDYWNFAVTRRDSGALVGGIGLEVRDWANGRGWTGYWIARPFWHRGYGAEAASAVCDVAFRRLKLQRIDAEVFDFNQRSMRLLRRLGFRREGRRRHVLRRGGRWYDEIAFGLLASEFRPWPVPIRD
jgi:RimJ/RimL family protein N-acetyltransferase